MHVPSFIEAKRDGRAHSVAEIERFIAGYTAEQIPDYQAAAWAMAVFFRGLDPAETGALTRAMMHSGGVLSHPPGSPPKVDKHSTGGIGDKVSLVLAPLLACAGVWVPMISGRGLGITGGTLDKLESIPGFRVDLPTAAIAAQLESIGVVMIGQSANLCPADKKLYALRDVTATVPSIPLIVASIMSKKLAETLDRLVLDVKYGSGAFMPSRGKAAELAEALSAVGRELGVETSYLLTPMDEPLGHTAGNALEVLEALETLRGCGPEDLVALTLDLAVRVADVPRSTLEARLADGAAWERFVAMVEAQGGDARALERLAEIHSAPMCHTLEAPRTGRLLRMDAGAVGRACVALGAGRTQASDPVDYAVGFSHIAKTGTHVEAGQPLAHIHARTQSTLDAALRCIESAIEIAGP
jgi:pyrimidine-nucleoside phosphorylase